VHIRLIAVGGRPPAWVASGVEDFRRRMSGAFRLTVEAIPAARRGGSIRTAIEDEGRRLLECLRTGDFVVALDEHGRELSTLELAAWLRERMQDGRDVTLLVGGPDGLAESVLGRCDLRWSLSRLTFPHALVRILVMEQLYRAQSILGNHPYHRE